MVTKSTYACELRVKFSSFDRGKAQTRRLQAFVFVGVTISGAAKRRVNICCKSRDRWVIPEDRGHVCCDLELQKESAHELRRSGIYWSNRAGESRVDSEAYASYGEAPNSCRAAPLKVGTVSKRTAQSDSIHLYSVRSETRFVVQGSMFLSLAVKAYVHLIQQKTKGGPEQSPDSS